MVLGDAGAMMRRAWRFLAGSPAAQLVAGGVAAVLVTGAVVVGGGGSTAPPAPAAVISAEQPAEPIPPAVPPAAVAPTTAAAEPRVVSEGLGVPPEPAAPVKQPVAAGGAAVPPPAGRAPTTPPAQPARVKAVVYDAIAGLGCTGKGTSYSHHGWFKNGDKGWWTLAYGSTREGGCDGRFDDMPMSGQAHADTAGQALVYGFKVGPARQTCALAVFVPTSSSARDVIAAPAHAVVITGTTIDAPLYTSPAPEKFVNQRDHHSTWLPLGSYPVTNGAIGVRFTNRGYSASYPVTDPHVAGGAVRARCTAD